MYVYLYVYIYVDVFFNCFIHLVFFIAKQKIAWIHLIILNGFYE